MLPCLREQSSDELADKVQCVLATKRLTLYQVSRRCEALYGRPSAYFVPHNLYHDLRSGSLRPSVYQMLALSRISGYRFEDWAYVFGFDLGDIPRSQVWLRHGRTILLDASLTDPGSFVSWFGSRPRTSVPSTAPLSHLLSRVPRRRIGSLAEIYNRGFLYAKIGGEDAYAFPDVLPGSIVRVNPTISVCPPLNKTGTTSDRLFLIEHSRGLCCSRLQVVDRGVVLPVSSLLSYAQVEFKFPQEVKILGVVDLELRSLVKPEPPEIPQDLAQRWKPRPLASGTRFGELLLRARANMHLSLREAALLTRRVSDVLSNEGYAVSSSVLWECEAFHALPRDFRKIMSLCCVYGLSFRSLLVTAGIALGEGGTDSMPDEFVRPRIDADDANGEATLQAAAGGFLDRLLNECQEVPFFLRDSIACFSGMNHVALEDFFWVGGEADPLYPYLRNGLVVVVNRRRKTAVHFASKAAWQQPVYMILTREGSYVGTCCGVENGTLVLHPYTKHGEQVYHPTQFQLHRDAEVVGRIVAVARGL